MKDLILSLSIFISTLFFSITTILGRELKDTYGYHIVVMVYAVLCVALLLIERIWKQTKYSGSNIMSLLVLFLIVVIGLVSESAGNTYFQQYIVFGIPAALVGMYYGSKNDISSLVKWFDVFCIIITISIFVSFPRYYNSRLLGDQYYSQKISYETAFAILLDIFLIKDPNRSRHFAFTNNKLYHAISIIILPILVLILVLSGGRGGFLTFLIGIIVKKKVLSAFCSWV